MKNLTKKELIAKVEQLEQRIESERQERIKNSFNKYQFLRDLEEGIKSEIENGNINDTDELEAYINQELDNAVIYYRNCFEIVMELNATSFNDWELGTPTDICQLAYFALYEYVNEEFDRDEFENLILERENN